MARMFSEIPVSPPATPLLDKIEQGESGEYGLCEGTGEPIPRARLELRPWARYSVEHKMVLERERALHSED